jgi:Fragile site-associated protein C-terminus
MTRICLFCSWSTKDLKSQGRLSIDSSGYKNMKILAGLGGSKLEARGGIIGGNIELQGLESEGNQI